MNFRNRVAMRIALRSASRQMSWSDRSTLRHAIVDADVLEALYYEKVQPAFEPGDTPILDWIQQLLQWIIENRDAIIEFIKAIRDALHRPAAAGRLHLGLPEQ